MDDNYLMNAIEAILFISGDRVPIKNISEFFDIDLKRVIELTEKLADRINKSDSSIKLVKIDKTYQLATRTEYTNILDDYFLVKEKQNLSKSAMETLSIIAYKQPITRMEVELIRGVRCEYAIRILSSKGLIKESGRLDSPGKPIIYATTEIFLRNFGLESLNDLPKIDDNINKDQ